MLPATLTREVKKEEVFSLELDLGMESAQRGDPGRSRLVRKLKSGWYWNLKSNQFDSHLLFDRPLQSLAVDIIFLLDSNIC